MSEESPIKVTLKGNGEPPWINLTADTFEEADASLDEVIQGLASKAAEAGAQLRGQVVTHYGLNVDSSSATVQDSTKDSASATASNGKASNGGTPKAPKVMTCQHGERRYVYLKAKKCDAYFCPVDDKAQQCKAHFEDHEADD